MLLKIINTVFFATLGCFEECDCCCYLLITGKLFDESWGTNLHEVTIWNTILFFILWCLS
jgi:hypothetical protein